MYANDNQPASEGSAPSQAGVRGSTDDGKPVQRSLSSGSLWRVIDELQPRLGSLGLGQREHTLRTTLKKLYKGELELADTLPLIIGWLYEGDDAACEFASRLEALLPPEEEVADEAQSLPSQLPISQTPMVETPPATSLPMPVNAAVTAAVVTQVPAKLQTIPAHAAPQQSARSDALGRDIPQGINADDVPVQQEKNAIEYGFLPQPDVHPLLTTLKISPYARNYLVPVPEERVARLEGSIGIHGVLQPILLVAVNGGEGGFYEIVCGAGRVAALKRLRPGGRLHETEYRIIDLDARDKRLASVSLTENRDRGGFTVRESAMLTQHLLEGEGFTQEELGKLLDKNQPEISGLISLAKRFDRLPASWQKQLAMLPETGPVISFSHWRVVSGRFASEKKAPGDLTKICEKAVEDEWSVARLSEALKADDKRQDTETTDTSGLQELRVPSIETQKDSHKEASDEAAMKLRQWVVVLHQIADEMHEEYPKLESKVRAALAATEKAIQLAPYRKVA